MTDLEISSYLTLRNFKVDSQNFLMDMLNTSPQIINEIYDFEKRVMTIITPNNKFSFKWTY